MKTVATDPRLDRLFKLLPAVYQMRDADQLYPLQALLRVIAEQINLVEDDIQQLYQNWFIETAEDWAVPYIGDLIGYSPLSDAEQAVEVTTAEGRSLDRVLIPRREVANTIAYRRRKGTLAVLELLGNDVADWPAHAVEFFKLLGWNQNIDHLHLDRAKTVDVRQMVDLDLLDSAFDSLAHTVEVRRINSHRTIGCYNIPSVGLFVWRLKSYSVTRSQPDCVGGAQPNCYTFSVLGQDAPLFIKSEPTQLAGEMNVPAPIDRLAFAKDRKAFYGADKSFAIWADDWAGFDPAQPVPVHAIIPADLSGWVYKAPLKHILVDPVLGRFAFPADQLPTGDVRVSYHYGFSADIGGGEYTRPISDPSPRKNPSGIVQPKFYRVGEGQQLQHLADAIDHWRQDKPQDALIEITDSGVYVESLDLPLDANQTLQLRAANGQRPVIRMPDGQINPHALTVTIRRDSRFTLDGLLVTGGDVRINGLKPDNPQDPRDAICGSSVVIRHCTLVPGWGLRPDSQPSHLTEPSLELDNVRATVSIEHSILGPIQIHEDAITEEPISVCVTDSILDATDGKNEAIGDTGNPVALAVLTIKRCTVFGIVDVQAIELAETCIFNDGLNVARRQLGCIRFCYVPYGSVTPQRYHCQPDLASSAIEENLRAEAAAEGLPAPTQLDLDAAKRLERLRVRPRFNNVRYGMPAYCQLADSCADEIKRGADDESDMGAFHDLFQPQREANLLARLEEFTPAGMDVGIIHAT